MNYTQRRSLGEEGGVEGNERDREDSSPLLGCCRACCGPGERAAADPAREDEAGEVSAQSQSAPPCPSCTEGDAAPCTNKTVWAHPLVSSIPSNQDCSRCSPHPTSFNFLQQWGCHRFPSQTTLKPRSSCCYSANAPEIRAMLRLCTAPAHCF